MSGHPSRAPARSRASGSLRGDPVLIAIIHGGDEVHGVVAARGREAVFGTLARELLDDVDLQLFPDEARRFRDAVAQGRTEEAVHFYFGTVGPKWDPLRLTVKEIVLR